VRALLRKFQDHIFFTLEAGGSENIRHSHIKDIKEKELIDFDAKGTKGLYETLQKIKDPSSLASPEQTLAANTEMSNKGIWKRFCKWITTNQFDAVVHDFGVISNLVYENNKRSCKVKAKLRNPNGKTVLTLEFSIRNYGHSTFSWIELDDKGIERLGQVIERMQENR